jgi:DNA-binding CsgD family transcriptional regulator
MSNKRAYSVLVVPITSPPRSLGTERVAAAVFVTDPEATMANLQRTLCELFALTKAEARLAEVLLGGGGLKPAADRLGITINTAKTHLQRVFQKTNTQRQSELVRVILGVPRSAL